MKNEQFEPLQDEEDGRPRRWWSRPARGCTVWSFVGAVVLGIVLVLAVIAIVLAVLVYEGKTDAVQAATDMVQAAISSVFVQVGAQYSAQLFVYPNGSAVDASVPIRATAGSWGLINGTLTISAGQSGAYTYTADAALLPAIARIELWMLNFNTTRGAMVQAPGSPFVLACANGTSAAVHCEGSGTFTATNAVYYYALAVFVPAALQKAQWIAVFV